MPLAHLCVQQQQQQQQQQQEQQQQQQQQPDSSVPVSSSRAGDKRSGGRGRGRGAVAAPATAASEEELLAEKERKEEERRARNRATQARFRERQKAKNEARLQEYAATEAALRRSRSEREQLEAEQAVLQKMLATKDAQLATVPPTEADGASGPGAAPGAGAALARGVLPGPAQVPLLMPAQRGVPGEQQAGAAAPGAEDSGSSGGSSGMRVSQGVLRHLSSSDLGAAPLSCAIAEEMGKLSSNLAAHLAQLDLPMGAHPDQALGLAQADLPASPSEQSALQGGPAAMQLSCTDMVAAGGAGDGAAAPGAAAGSTLQAMAAGERKLEDLMRERPDLVQKVQTITPEEFVAEWRQQALAIRAVLEAQDASGASEADLTRVVGYLREFSVVMGLALRLRPEVVQGLFATAANAPPGQWEAVAAAIAPTAAQRTTIRQLWHAYAGQVQALSAERAAAIQAVHHAAAHPPAAAGAAGVGRALGCLPADNLGDVMSRYLGLFDAAGKLSSLQDAEFVAMLQFLGRTGLVFSPVQKARLAAVSCPHFPDIVQVARLLAEEGEAKA